MIYPWQRSQWHRLQAARRAGRLPHALLLSGPPGTGKGVFATALARSLLCHGPSAEGLPCERCADCRLSARGNHPDLRKVAPQEAAVIRIEQVRELSDYLQVTSHRDGPRVAILEPAEAMNRHAANGLLKTLEEPPGGTLLVLVTAQAGAVPVTLRSRCQEVRLAAWGAEALAWLRERLAPEVDAQTVLAMAGGGPLAALDLAAKGVPGQGKSLLGMLAGLHEGRLDPLVVARGWAEQGALSALLSLRLLLQDLIKLAMTGEGRFLAYRELEEGLKEFAERIDLQQLFRAYDQVVSGWRLLGSASNLRPSDILEDIAVEWAVGGLHGGTRA